MKSDNSQLKALIRDAKQAAWDACDRTDCVPETDGTASGHLHAGEEEEE